MQTVHLVLMQFDKIEMSFLQMAFFLPSSLVSNVSIGDNLTQILSERRPAVVHINLSLPNFQRDGTGGLQSPKLELLRLKLNQGYPGNDFHGKIVLVLKRPSSKCSCWTGSQLQILLIFVTDRECVKCLNRLVSAGFSRHKSVHEKLLSSLIEK